MSLFRPRYKSVKEVRLIMEGGTWLKKSLDERSKASSLLKFPNSEGSDELKLL